MYKGVTVEKGNGERVGGRQTYCVTLSSSTEMPKHERERERKMDKMQLDMIDQRHVGQCGMSSYGDYRAEKEKGKK